MVDLADQVLCIHSIACTYELHTSFTPRDKWAIRNPRA